MNGLDLLDDPRAMAASGRHLHRPASPLSHMAWLTIRTYARMVMRRELQADIDGWEHVPPRGPVVLAARHVHHLYDACALVASAPRPLHLMVALDWARTPVQRRVLELACAAARWPGVIRPESIELNPDLQYGADEIRARLRSATVLASDLLCEGRALLVFPEGYPIHDPWPTPRPPGQVTLPFHRGFVTVARRASQRLGMPVPIVPVGIRYADGAPPSIRARIGVPLVIDYRDRPETIIAETVRCVRELS